MAESRRKSKAENAAPAEPQRRSKPRKVEPVDTEEGYGPGHGLHLASYAIGAVGILLGMIIIATFLTNNEGGVPMPLLAGFGAAAVVTAALYALGSLRNRRAA